jgi:hypothetical protein
MPMALSDVSLGKETDIAGSRELNLVTEPPWLLRHSEVRIPLLL